jgi:hypothetical protein
VYCINYGSFDYGQSLWAALSETPSKYAKEQPGTHTTSFVPCGTLTDVRCDGFLVRLLRNDESMLVPHRFTPTMLFYAAACGESRSWATDSNKSIGVEA